MSEVQYDGALFVQNLKRIMKRDGAVGVVKHEQIEEAFRDTIPIDDKLWDKCPDELFEILCHTVESIWCLITVGSNGRLKKGWDIITQP